MLPEPEPADDRAATRSVGRSWVVLVVAIAAVCLSSCSAWVGSSGTSVDHGGGTSAPDLREISGFRPGPPTSRGEPQTVVDFTFDDVAHLVVGDRRSFQLVSFTAGEPLAGLATAPEEDAEGDETVSVLFPGDLDRSTYSRGYVETGVVSANAEGATSASPLNVNQSASISRQGRTANPDLVEVTLDGDLVRFEFDQELTTDDISENSGALRLYFPETDGATTIREAGSLIVRAADPWTLVAYFGDDLPGDSTLSDAVGAFVRRGAVRAARGARGGNEGVNAFDQVDAVISSGPAVCPAADQVGQQGGRNGPTTAPDLLAAGNVRPGPTTSQFEPTTCVDFVFDQPAHLVGGDRTNFHLVPVDGGDMVDATTAIEVPDDDPDDRVVTVAFPGTVVAGDVARAVVDTGTVGSSPEGATADDPLNVNQSARLGNDGRTRNPDLVGITIDGDQVLFDFDQPLTDDDVVQNTSGLRLYFPDVSGGTRIASAVSSVVVRDGRHRLRAIYNTLPGDVTLDDAVGGYVVQGAVQATPGGAGANDGVNGFHEVAPLETTDLVVCAPSQAAGRSGRGGGPTDAPDLLAVGNFRPGPTTTQGGATTCVDFRFDQPAELVGGDRTNFHLVPLDADDVLDATTDVAVPGDQPGDLVVTIAFPGELTAAGFARGFVDTGVVGSDATGATGDDPLNINQSAPIANDGFTQNPDLVAVHREGRELVFEFDQPLTDDDVVQSTSGLRIYFAEARQGTRVPEVGAQEVAREGATALRATFAGDLPDGRDVARAVGAFVQQGAVQAARGSRGANDGAGAFDEITLEPRQ